MTDNVDFKAAKEWAEMAVDPIRPISPYERNNASAYLALCELLKEREKAWRKAYKKMLNENSNIDELAKCYGAQLPEELGQVDLRAELAKLTENPNA